MNKFEVGSIIKATSGRENGEMFVISQINLNDVLLVNGKTRKLEKPKRKNIKHIYLLLKETELKELFENNAITDAHVITILKKYKNNELGGN